MSKTILITGCSTGIGYVCAHALNQQGFNVIASCRQPQDVARLQEEGLTCIQLDLNDPASISKAVTETMLLCDNNLYALFNNGAYGQPGALEDLPVEALKEQFQSNFFGWHQLVCEILPYMRKNGYGRIIQNSSVLGFAAMKYRGAYNASKFAIEGWSDTLRLELHNTDIKLSIIQPGPIETQFRANGLLKLNQWIDVTNSEHKQAYRIQLDRLADASSKNKFVLPAESIIAPLLHALNSPKPKLRYRVTTPTKVFSVLKRILPTRWLDSLLRKAA
ncbi:SDR family oxidoreductase [Vibrio sp. TH_r3]|uniref:SDR family oxidoreductase n=1 Tax=Vibrio sp. TH_r3 TaxID=3082084 RepID=UPI0029542F08|nr:SDR family oxidoreductase [Vibrio sp. TH_r3]MDV7103248.1 SDR family oxidoreductase [Vibrio sp. TH_r3]